MKFYELIYHKNLMSLNIKKLTPQERHKPICKLIKEINEISKPYTGFNRIATDFQENYVLYLSMKLTKGEPLPLEEFKKI